MILLSFCRHKRVSFPITKRPGERMSPASAVTGTYIVCLDCGREFPYDWQAMKVIKCPAVKQKPIEREIPLKVGE